MIDFSALPRSGLAAVGKPSLTHKLLSPLLLGSGGYRAYWRSLTPDRPVAVTLTYHRVVAASDAATRELGMQCTPAATFERQMRFMLSHFRPVRCADLAARAHGEPVFAVSLDDGFEDNFRVAAPILQALGIPATFFVVSNYVGTDRLFWWERLAPVFRETARSELDCRGLFDDAIDGSPTLEKLQLTTATEREAAFEHIAAVLRRVPHGAIETLVAELETRLQVAAPRSGRTAGLMDWDQVQALAAAGFDIGAHTRNHTNVVGLNSTELEDEVAGSVQDLRERLARPIETFAYPYGTYSREQTPVVADVLRAAGCEYAFTSERTAAPADVNPFEIPRVMLVRGMAASCAFRVHNAIVAAA